MEMFKDLATGESVIRDQYGREVRFDADSLNKVAFSPSGGVLQPFINEELVDFAGEDELAAVATVGNLLPAGSLILGVSIYCVTAFTGDASNFDVGDETTATRFATNSTKIAAGNADLFLEASVVQAAASKIEFLLDDAATAGAVRVAAYGFTLTGLTS
jgi:hypothetical protein